MAAKSTVFDSAFLNLVLNSVAVANFWDNAASSPLTQLWLSLHTADPTPSGSQPTSECSYGGYARVAVTRTGAGWTVASGVATLAAAATFPTSTGAPSQTATYFGIGRNASGAGSLIYSGPITPNIAISTGVTPQLTTSTTITEQ